MTIHFSAFVVCLVLGIVALVIAIVKENNLTSATFWWCAIWVAALALLYPGA